MAKHYLSSLILGVGVALTSPAMAAEETGGLPQLDLTTWPTQIFWLIVSFGIAYLLMWRVITPSITSVLEARHTRLNDDMRQARMAADEAEQMRISFEETLSNARSSAAMATREAVASAQADADKKNEAAAKRLGAKIDKAEAAIAKAKTAALREIGDVATDGAVAAVTAITGIKMTNAEAKKFVTKATTSMASTKERG